MSNDSTIDDLIANDPEMLESFLNESREFLIVAETELKSLQKDSDKPDPERIERAFRSVHSIKSAAGFLGLDNVSFLALQMEEILGRLRDHDTVLEGNVLHLLLEGVGLLNIMLANPKDSSTIDTATFLEKLSAYSDASK